MIGASEQNGARYHGRTFLLVNLLGFPVAGVLMRALLRVMAVAGTQLWIPIALTLGVGIALMIANIVLVGLAYRSPGWTASTIAMAGWSLVCIATLILLGSYSPLNLALALGMYVT